MRLAVALAIAAGCTLMGCKPKDSDSGEVMETVFPGTTAAPSDVAGDIAPGKATVEAGPVAFAAASATNDDPAAAAKAAAMEAVAGLGCPAKGLIFYEYFPKTTKDAEGKDKEVPDTEKEKAVLPALRSVAGSMPVIGCRARSLTNEGTKLENTVAVLVRGMKPDEEFTSDRQHPIGVIVGDDKVYLRMVLEEDGEKKGLRFVAAVPEGTKVKILKGGDDPKAILASAGAGITESLGQAGDVPIFGSYAWGELGPIAGPFGGLRCMYQQHTFVSAVVTEAE